jgi:hypothetical protein
VVEFGRIEFGLAWSDYVVLRLLRRWVASRTMAEKALPSLIELAGELGEQPEAAISLHSVFQLTESCLGRPLDGECCCSRSLAPDERAILALVAAAPPTGTAAASSDVPHGLTGALAWAVMSARIALGIADDRPPDIAYSRCPFEHDRSALA